MQRLAAALPVLLASGAALAGPNLLQNAHFDNANSLAPGSGWTITIGPGNIVWASAPEHSGTSGSGSAQASLGGPAPVPSSLRQCVPVTPNTAYVFGAWGQTNLGNPYLQILVDWYATADCSTTSLGGAISFSGALGTTWTLASASANSPATALGARLSFDVYCYATTCVQSLDDAFFGPPPLTPVSLQGFDVQ